MGVVCCVRIDLFKAVLGFQNSTPLLCFQQGRKAGAFPPPPPVGQHMIRRETDMKKRFPAFFLALALCLGLAVPALAVEGDTSAQLYTWISEDFPYVGQNLECKMRALNEARTSYSEAKDWSGTVDVIPTHEYFYVGVYELAKDEENGILIMAYTDHDGDGVYDQRLFQTEVGTKNISVLPIPENGTYKTTGPVAVTPNAISILGFDKVEDGDYAFSAARLHEFFGDNTLIYFLSETSKSVLGCVLLSAGAFDDVPGRGWYSDTVAWAADKGITTGTGDNIFEPGSDCTQSQILTFLWRAEGKPEAAKAAPVTVEEWYQDAINWAYDKGMIDSSFKGDEPCERAIAVDYIWQAKGKPSAQVSNFTDMEGYENYAKAVDWANEKKITTGVGGGMFDPGSVCNRAQIATFLYRAYNN